jgi:hypothetical protein
MSKNAFASAVGAEQEANDERCRIGHGEKDNRGDARPEAMQQRYRKERDCEHDINSDDPPKLAAGRIKCGESKRDRRNTPSREIEHAEAPRDLLWILRCPETECLKKAHWSSSPKELG